MRANNNLRWHATRVDRTMREQLQGHRSTILWFTGLSGAGKSTLAHAVEEALNARSCRTYVLDGDNIRHGLCADLGFSAEDRAFIEIWCASSLEVCEQRDVKGLYAKAREGLIQDFTGISAPYEVPESPELVLDTGSLEVTECVDLVLRLLTERSILANLS